MRYSKLTAENYDYWWYETDDINKANKRVFTYDWSDMLKTKRFKMLEALSPYHDDNEDICVILNIALNLESALHDGVDINTGRHCFDEVFDMYYSGRRKENKQLTLF